LMRNHYHLVVSERVEGGLTRFLRKLNVGYAKYFNERYERSGTLFQGRTKKILIVNDAHFLHILHYIHLNPLDFLDGASSWREGRIESVDHALAHLDSYRWSSFADYCGNRNFPSLLTTELFAGIFTDYRKTISAYLEDCVSFSEAPDLE
jgi:putative transposase